MMGENSLRPEKRGAVLFPEIGRVEIFLPPALLNLFQDIFFNLKKNKKTNKSNKKTKSKRN